MDNYVATHPSELKKKKKRSDNHDIQVEELWVHNTHLETHQISYSEYILEFISHGVMLHSHKQCV